MDAHADEEEYMEKTFREEEPQCVGLPEKNLGLFHRSYAAAVAVTDTGHINRSSANSAVSMNDNVAARIARRRQSYLDNIDLDPIILQESTHTLLYTEPINSAPFIISILIATLSIICLFLALFNNGVTRSDMREVIPANVDKSVKVAQYICIIVALLMEEEIPIGLFQLERISRQYFISTFPELSYRQFVFSNVLRIVMGYLFLINVLLILWKANEVMEVFFDFIALQFIQQLGESYCSAFIICDVLPSNF